MVSSLPIILKPQNSRYSKQTNKHESKCSKQALHLPPIRQHLNPSKSKWTNIVQLNHVISTLKNELKENDFTTFNKIIRSFNSWENNLQGVFVFGDDLMPRSANFEVIMQARHAVMRLLIEGRQKLGNLYIISAIKQLAPPDCKISFLRRGDQDPKLQHMHGETLSGIETPTKYHSVQELAVLRDRGFAARFQSEVKEISVIAPKAPGSQELTSDIDYTIRCQDLDLLVAIITRAEELFIQDYKSTMSQKLDLSLYPPNLEFPDLSEHLKGSLGIVTK